ncbi:hypothetical protein GCM10012280_45360 [Wenjunlia tyrosinilytica]|uniref:HTH lysR-type domain-containing protein n=1 Tax=Wenjunlia tyrosinilytica TaxID=1544741 RepID=A0A917ZSV4_9ACTN|nr:hypothetical protein GCM10012280_45360 [Wenjunlia tyrosinilytica]
MFRGPIGGVAAGEGWTSLGPAGLPAGVDAPTQVEQPPEEAQGDGDGDRLARSRAAAMLHMSQPTLSQIVRRLEDAFGIALLTRTTRSVRLTPNGRMFLGEARAVLERFDAAMPSVPRPVWWGG